MKMWVQAVSALLVVVVSVLVSAEDGCYSRDQAYRSTSRCICSPQVTVGSGISSNASNNLLEVILAQVVSQNKKIEIQSHELDAFILRFAHLENQFNTLSTELDGVKSGVNGRLPVLEKGLENIRSFLLSKKEEEAKREEEKRAKAKKAEEKKRKEEERRKRKEEEDKRRKEEEKKVKEFRYARDCAEIQRRGSRKNGIYRIKTEEIEKPYDVYCDLNTDGGGWTVIQRRMDGVTRFQRSWNSYKYGFGKLDYEFWLGNDKIHYLTTRGAEQEIRFDMTRFNGNYGHAKYSSFHLAAESNNYRLLIGQYTGTVGDGMRHHNKEAFSTYDRDNDVSSFDCSSLYRGGWWYSKCYDVNPNGLYYHNARMMDAIVWYAWTRNHEGLKHIEMKIRPAGFKP